MTTLRQPFITFARGFAIITIVLWHLSNRVHLPAVLAKGMVLGGAGVHLFIFVSGYGLALSTYKGFASFLKRRFSKVLIPYYIIITLIFIVNIFLNLYPDDWRAYLSHIFLYKMFFDKYEMSLGHQFWFISTIIQFYVFFPLILRLVNSFSAVKAVTIALVISLGYSLFTFLIHEEGSKVWNSFFLQYLWEFVLGMVIARQDLLKNILAKSIFVFVLLGGISLAIMALLVFKGGKVGQNFNDCFSFIGYTCCCIAIFKLGISFFNRFIFWVESFSYSLYLIHIFIFSLYLKFIGLQEFRMVDVVPVLAVTFIAAFLINKLIVKLMGDKQRPLVKKLSAT